MALSAGAAGASALLWWAAGNRKVSETRLHTLGLVYEVAICFVMAVATFWPFYLDNRTLPNLTWVPAVVILFPLILPGPPRRMLAAAILAAAMPPLALLLLELSGKVAADSGDYVDLFISGAFAVAFAYMGAGVVYRLGREVVAVRELGSYRLEEQLGQGGMGEVWRAQHRMLARPAAIKVIHPALSQGPGPGASLDLQHRFERRPGPEWHR